jgi:hypothetical protein
VRGLNDHLNGMLNDFIGAIVNGMKITGNFMCNTKKEKVGVTTQYGFVRMTISQMTGFVYVNCILIEIVLSRRIYASRQSRRQGHHPIRRQKKVG